MNYGESRKPQGVCEGAAWLSSARAVRCRLKCHNERNPCCQLLTGSAEDSDKTAIVRCEEGGDDVKSARPLRPGLHTCYNGGYRGPLPREWMPIPKTSLSSDWSLQPDSTKLDSLVIAHQRQNEPGKLPSLSGFQVISMHFTATSLVPPPSSRLQVDSFNGVLQFSCSLLPLT